MDDSNNRKFGALLSYFSIIASTVISLVYTPFMIRSLGQSEYGLFSLINSVIGYLTLLDLGFGNAIVVYTSKYRAQKKYEEEKKLHGMFFMIFCIIALISGLCGIILFFNVDNLFGSTMNSLELHKAKILMIILTINLVLSFVFNIYQCILNAYEKFVFQKVISILNTILRPIIMIPLLFLGYKSITMAIVLTVLNVLALLSNYIYCRKKLDIKIKYRGFDKAIFVTILGYSIWLFLGTIVDKINWSVDQFVLGAVSGTVAVSIYSVASTLNNLFINLSTSISGVMLPKMSKMVATNASSEDITNEFIKVGRIQYLIILLMGSGFVLFGKQFIIAWVGEDFVTSYYVALLLILPMCIPLIQNLGLSIMQAMNKFKFRTIATSIMSIFNIILSVFLAKLYGPVGSAIGTTISLVLVNIIIINIYYYKVIKINIPKFWANIIKMTIPQTISVVIILIIMNFIKLNGFVNLVVFGGIYTFMYSMICYFVTMNDYEKGLINKVLIKLHIKKGN